MEVRVELSRIIINEASDQQVVVLKEIGGERSIPIVIGISEILAIDRRIKGMQLPRPMTHDLMAGIITVIGGKIEKIVITDLNNHTFYALMHINFNGKKFKIDSRPSDALALTAGMQVPIFADEQVFEKMQM